MAIFAALVNALAHIPYETAMVIAFLSLLPLGFAMFKWKKWRESKIDQAAIRETQFMLSMSPEDRRMYEQKLTKYAMRTVWLVMSLSMIRRSVGCDMIWIFVQ